MPRISQFYDIKIAMFYDDHNEPHFHAYYGDEQAEISITQGTLITGNLPRRAKNLIFAWVKEHREELLENWDLAAEHKELKKIKPLE